MRYRRIVTKHPPLLTGVIWRCLFLSVLLPGSQACAASGSLAEDRPPHHTSEGFQNYPPTKEPSKLGLGFYWKRFIASFSSPDVPEHHVMPREQALAEYEALKNENTLTWIGQSTLILKINSVVILTDPYFAKLASPFMVGPERFIPSGIAADEMPSVDIILLSHNHYDHLDEAFIEALPSKAQTQVIVPLGMEPFFTKRGYRHVHQLDWYQSIRVAGMKFTALPAVHYSGRGSGDKNKTLWCAWAIEGEVGQYYFLGDSAYSSTLFKETGETFPPFDLAIVPIGTYGNRKYGVNNHTNPEEAVTLATELNAKRVMGVHWGTIELSDEDAWEPQQRFRDAAEIAGYSSKDIWVLKIGETRPLPTTLKARE